jgi:hypothetical protein
LPFSSNVGIIRELATMSIQNDQLISVREAAAIIGCTGRRVRQLVESEQIKGEHLHARTIVVSRESAESYATKEQTRGRPRGGRPRAKN